MNRARVAAMLVEALYWHARYTAFADDPPYALEAENALRRIQGELNEAAENEEMNS